MKKVSKVAALLCMALFVLAVFSAPARAEQWERIVFSNTKAAAVTNTAAFYNAQVLAVRAWNLASSDVTNAITLRQVTPEGITNQIAAFSITTIGQAIVSTSNLMLLRNDVLALTASTNATAEVIIDNRSR